MFQAPVTTVNYSGDTQYIPHIVHNYTIKIIVDETSMQLWLLVSQLHEPRHEPRLRE